jgi:hypothetical protein
MNLLDLVPILERHLRQYKKKTDTASTLAGYIADGIQALEYRWDRTYTITYVAPATYSVSPDILSADIRPVILMASIIYKMGNYSTVKFSDGDFSYDPQSKTAPIILDIDELKTILPTKTAGLLATGRTAPMRGFNNIYNNESYNWMAIYDMLI